MDAYDPIAVLMEEHQRFLHRLDTFSSEFRTLSEQARIPVAGVRAILDFSQFLARDVDGWHARKEEEVVFPALANYVPTEAGPIRVMLFEHESLREQQRSIEQGGRRLESDPEAVEALRSVEGAERSTRTLLQDHIEKEDQILFPMARTLLSPKELADVARRCEEIDARESTTDR